MTDSFSSFCAIFCVRLFMQRESIYDHLEFNGDKVFRYKYYISKGLGFLLTHQIFRPSNDPVVCLSDFWLEHMQLAGAYISYKIPRPILGLNLKK